MYIFITFSNATRWQNKKFPFGISWFERTNWNLVMKLHQVTLWSKYLITIICTTGGHHCDREYLKLKSSQFLNIKYSFMKTQNPTITFVAGRIATSVSIQTIVDVSFFRMTKKDKQTQSNLHWNNGSVWQANDRHIKDASSHRVLTLLQYCANNNIP